MNKIKVLHVEAFYSTYLKRVYEENTFLEKMRFDEQTMYLLSDGFSSPHNLSPFFDPKRFECLYVIKNCTQTQNAWAQENGVKAESLLDILIEQIRLFAPDIVYLSDIYGFPFVAYQSLRTRPFTVAWLASRVLDAFPWYEIDLLLSGIKAVRDAALAKGAKKVAHFMPAAPLYIKGAPQRLNSYKNRAVFAGSLVTGIHDSRLQQLFDLIRANPKITFDLFTSANAESYEPLPNCNFLNPVFASELLEVYSAYPIVVDLRGDFGLNEEAMEVETANMRIFEALAAGACVFTNYSVALSQAFADHPFVFTYKSSQEFVTKFSEAFELAQKGFCNLRLQQTAFDKTSSGHSVMVKAAELQNLVLTSYENYKSSPVGGTEIDSGPNKGILTLVARVTETELLCAEHLLFQARALGATKPYRLFFICCDRGSYRRLSRYADHILSLAFLPGAQAWTWAQHIKQIEHDFSVYRDLAQVGEGAIFVNLKIGIFDLTKIGPLENTGYSILNVAGAYAGLERVFPEYFNVFYISAVAGSLEPPDFVKLFEDFTAQLVNKTEVPSCLALNFVPIATINENLRIGYHLPGVGRDLIEASLEPIVSAVEYIKSFLVDARYHVDQVLGIFDNDVLTILEHLSAFNHKGGRIVDFKSCAQIDEVGLCPTPGEAREFKTHPIRLAISNYEAGTNDGILDECCLDPIKSAIKALNLSGRTLNIGCGTGYIVAALNEIGIPCVGVDSQSRVIEIACRNFPGLEFACFDKRALSYRDAGFESVIDTGSLAFARDYAVALAEAMRVSGGLTILVGLNLSNRPSHIFLERCDANFKYCEIIFSDSQLGTYFGEEDFLPLWVEGANASESREFDLPIYSQVTAALYTHKRYFETYRSEGVYFCTLFDMNYLAKGLCLIESLFQHRPNSKLVVLCLDDFTYDALGSINLQGEIVRVPLNELVESDKEFGEAKSNRSLIEWYFTATSVLAHFVATTFEDCQFVIYLDADLYFFGPCDHLIKSADLFDTQIIGHNFSPKYQGAMKYGTYNVGWVLFNLNRNGLKVIADYRSDCLDWCYDYLDGDRFGDQKYLEKWPSRYKVQEVFNNAYNLAVWNYEKSSLEKYFGKVYVDGLMLCFAHIQGVRCLDDARFQVIYNEGTLKGQMIEIYASYLEKLNGHHRRLTEFTGYGSKIIRFTKVT